MRVGIIAALPREVSGLVKGWERRELPGHIHVFTSENAAVACAGMGAARAVLAVHAAMAAMPLTDLLSVGLAGACDPRMKAGEIVRAGVVVEEATGERFYTPQFSQVLVSTPAISSVEQKGKLHASCAADAVDMEAAAVARLAQAHGLSFHAIKAISDEADFEVAELAKFATADGQFREGAFALHAALRPALWGRVMALARNSGKALDALTAALKSELDWYRNAR